MATAGIIAVLKSLPVMVASVRDGLRGLAARGKIVVEEDIVDALKSGKLGGYATDVWYSDPPVDSPLMDAPNTLFLPHLGASSKENMGRIAIIVDRIIGEYVAKKG